MKLTLVSVYSNGLRTHRFVNARMVNGKAVVAPALIASLLKDIGCVDRGQTYSVS